MNPTHYRHYNIGHINKMTLAIKKVDDTYLVGYALCSSKDNFSKSKGRTLANQRLLENITITLQEIKDSLTPTDFVLTQEAIARTTAAIEIDDININYMFKKALDKLDELNIIRLRRSYE